MSRLVAQARTWLGVPYLHQGSNRHGADCRGFVRGAYEELGVVLDDYRAYGQEADPERLLAGLRAALGPEVAAAPVAESDLRAGDVALFHFPKSNTPRHLAIIGDHAIPWEFTFIEANGNEKRVIERRLDDRYRARITHLFRRPV